MGSFWGHLGAISGHLGHLGAVLGHFGAISGSYHVHLAPFQVYDFGKWLCIVDFAKFALGLEQMPILVVLGSVLAPSWLHLRDHLRAISGHLAAFPKINTRKAIHLLQLSFDWLEFPYNL